MTQRWSDVVLEEIVGSSGIELLDSEGKGATRFTDVILRDIQIQ